MKSKTKVPVPTDTTPSGLAELKGLLKTAPPDLASIEPPYGCQRSRWPRPSGVPGKKLIHLTSHESLIAFANPNDPSHRAVVEEFSKCDTIVVTEEILDETAGRLNLISHDGIPVLFRLVSAGVLLVASDSRSQKLIQSAKSLTLAIEGAARALGGRVAVMTPLGTLSGTTRPRASLTRSNDFLIRFGTGDGINKIPDRPTPPKYPSPVFQHDPPGCRR